MSLSGGTSWTGPLFIKKDDGTYVEFVDENGVINVAIPAVQNAISTATAIGLTAYNTTIDSTSGALALTLASGTFKGQARRVQMIVDNGDATLTFNTNATIVFADVGDVAELIWSGTAWIPVALYNIVDGATAPAYTPAS